MSQVTSSLATSRAPMKVPLRCKGSNQFGTPGAAGKSRGHERPKELLSDPAKQDIFLAVDICVPGCYPVTFSFAPSQAKTTGFRAQKCFSRRKKALPLQRTSCMCEVLALPSAVPCPLSLIAELATTDSDL